MTDGLFIVFEGIDGSGKTTQVQRLVAALQQHGRRCHATFEPTLGPAGAVLRQYLQRRVLLPRAALPYLFAADRSDHLYNEQNGVETLLGQGIDVVCDRYVLSNLAYQADDERGFSLVESLNSHFRYPDLTFFLRVDPQDGLGLKSRKQPVADVTETIEQQTGAARQFERAIALYGQAHNVVVLDAWTLVIEGCAEVILKHTLARF